MEDKKKTSITQVVKGASVLNNCPYHILMLVFSHSLAKVDSKHSLNFTDVSVLQLEFHFCIDDFLTIFVRTYVIMAT